MARRNSTETVEAPAEAQVEETTSTEQVEPTEPTTEGTEASTEGSTETPAAPAEVDLTAFQTVANEAVEERDQATGVVPVEQIERVNVEYRKLDGIKAKNRAKDWLEDGIKDAISPEKLDAVLARAFSSIRESLKAGSAAVEKAPADPKVAHVNKVAAHRLAYGLVLPAPEGVDQEEVEAEIERLVGELQEQVGTYQTWLANEAEDKGDAPEVSPVVKSAFKLAQGKASGGGRTSGGGSGERHDIGKHIVEAFANVEDGGFLTVAQIATFKSSEYPDGKASQGAVSARLFPSNGGETTVPGVRQAAPTKDRVKGATKDSSKS